MRGWAGPGRAGPPLHLSIREHPEGPEAAAAARPRGAEQTAPGRIRTSRASKRLSAREARSAPAAARRWKGHGWAGPRSRPLPRHRSLPLPLPGSRQASGCSESRSAALRDLSGGVHVGERVYISKVHIWGLVHARGAQQCRGAHLGGCTYACVVHTGERVHTCAAVANAWEGRAVHCGRRVVPGGGLRHCRAGGAALCGSRALWRPGRRQGRREAEAEVGAGRPRRQHAAPVAAEDGAEPPHAGGAEERRDLQRALGELRQLDEHQPPRSHLHVPGWGQVLEDARVLHSRQHHQVSAHPGRDHRHGEGGGGVQGQGPRWVAAAEAAEGPWSRRHRARCVRRPRPRDSRQRPRAAGKEARQAVCKAVSSCLYPAQGQCWSLAGLSSQGCQVFRGVGSLACR